MPFVLLGRRPALEFVGSTPLNVMNVVPPFGYGIGNGSGGYDTSTAYQLGYASWTLAMPSALRTAVKAAGIDTWRVVVECSPLCFADNHGADGTTELDIYIAQLEAMLNAEIAGGMKVIVNIYPHSGPANSGYNVVQLISDAAGFNGTAFQRLLTVEKRLLGMIETLNRPDMVAFTAYNEWPSPGSFAGHTTTQYREYLHAALRQGASKTALVYSAPDFASAAQTVLMTPINDPNSIVDFHFYEDIAFTYQSHPTPPVGGLQYVTGLEFPPDTTNANSVLSTAKDAIDADTGLSGGQKTTYKANLDTRIGGYRDTPRDSTYMSGLLDPILSWADTNSLARPRILCGENGSCRDGAATYPGASTASRAAYGEAWRTICKAGGISRGHFELEDTSNRWVYTDGSQNVLSYYATTLSA